MTEQTATTVSKCGICGKPLTDPNSIANGVGPECLSKLGKLGVAVPEPGESVDQEELKAALERHQASVTVEAVPEGWIKLIEVTAKVKEMGIPANRFGKAFGGDRHLDEPLNEHFKVVYVGRTRYMSPTVLDQLESLRTMGSTERAEKAAERKAKQEAAKAVKAEKAKAMKIAKAEKAAALKAERAAKAETRKQTAAEKAAARAAQLERKAPAPAVGRKTRKRPAQPAAAEDTQEVGLDG